MAARIEDVRALSGNASPRRYGMPDVTMREIDEMDSIGGGFVRRARAELGVTAWGMQVMNLPAEWESTPSTSTMPTR